MLTFLTFSILQLVEIHMVSVDGLKLFICFNCFFLFVSANFWQFSGQNKKIVSQQRLGRMPPPTVSLRIHINTQIRKIKC